MNQHTSIPVLTALMLALSAGTAAPAGAQSADRPTRDSAAAAPALDFRSADWLSDRKVVNTSGDEIADVSDLILDRGSGRIEFLVIKTGTGFGLGGKAVAVPYSAFRWETGKARFTLDSTAEQLKQFPEFSAESWKAMMESKRDDNSTLRQRLAADAASPGDPYAGRLDTATRARVEGEVKNVQRLRTSTFGEQVMITVQVADGSDRKIALGPTWFINGTAAAPMRGDRVVVETLALPGDADQLLAGATLRTGDRELRLRDTDGSPFWALKDVESGGHSYSTPYSRYLLLSHLPGMKVDCRGQECGTVHDIILDKNSGEIGFLSIDPNQNFVGVSDNKRLVPWSVATVTLDGNVRIDASKDMVLASPDTPSNLATLNTGPTAAAAYAAYKVPAPRFEPRNPLSSADPAWNDAWCAGGPVLGAIEPNSGKTLQGKVMDITEIKFESEVQPARAMRVRMAGGEELVLLGPAWYMEKEKSICRSGDAITMHACRTRIDGKGYWLAKSIDCRDARVVLLDGNNAPAWTQR